jgi:hypothetical protein
MIMVGAEMRAIYASLPLDFDNDGNGKKVVGSVNTA